MKRKLEELFDELLEQIARGKDADECLKEWKEYADDLKPLLTLARSITDLPKPEPREQARTEALRRVRRIALAAAQQRKPFVLKPLIAWQPAVVRVVAALLLVVVVGLTGSLLSAHSLPGEPLYPVKRLTERLLYFVTVDAQGRAELHLRFADRRTQEFIYVLEPGEKINRELLSEMMNEMQQAFSCAKKLPEGRYAATMQQVAQYNDFQRIVLENTRTGACVCDHAVLDEAVSLCHERHTCLECHHQQKTDQPCVCECWQKEYHFE